MHLARFRDDLRHPRVLAFPKKAKCKQQTISFARFGNLALPLCFFSSSPHRAKQEELKQPTQLALRSYDTLRNAL